MTKDISLLQLRLGGGGNKLVKTLPMPTTVADGKSSVAKDLIQDILCGKSMAYHSATKTLVHAEYILLGLLNSEKAPFSTAGPELMVPELSLFLHSPSKVPSFPGFFAPFKSRKLSSTISYKPKSCVAEALK